MTNKVKLSDIQEGKIKHPALPDAIIERIKAYKAILGDVEPSSLEQTVDSFKRDTTPESELVLWERMANTYATYLAHNPTDNPEIKREIFSAILGVSMGMDDWSRIKHLTSEQINHIKLNYTGI